MRIGLLCCKWIVRGCFFLVVQTACGQSMGGSWFARPWQTAHGLPDNVIHALAQTPDSYLWVATDSGLARFNGAEFETYSLSRLGVGPTDRAQRLFLDSRRRFWIALNTGTVLCLESNGFRAFTFQTGGPSSAPTSFAEDGQGSIWLARADGRVLRIRDGTATTLGETDGMPAGDACTLAADVDGRIWFVRNQHVGRFEEGKFRTLFTFDRATTQITRAAAGGVWVCAGPELFRFQREGVGTKRAKLPGDPSPTVLLEDRSGILWIGTTARGLHRFDGQEMISVRTSHREISCIMQDHEGNVTIGTAGGGINRLRPRIVELLGTDTGAPFESLRSVCQDTGGAVWVVTRNGSVFRQESTNWVDVSARSDWPGGRASCVAADATGTVWIGTRSSGLHGFRDGRFRTWRQRNGLAGDAIRSLLVDSRGALWVAGDWPAALQRLHEDKLRNFDLPEVQGGLQAMTEDQAGTIWVGTGDGRLFGINGDAVAEQSLAGGNQSAPIRSLLATPDGSLWIGYEGRGLGRLKAGHYGTITPEEGLDDDSISQILDDGRGWLWFGGTFGFFKVQQSALIDVAEGRSERVRSLVYEEGQGLTGLQAAYGNSPASCRGADGRLWTATRRGLAVIHADRIQENTTAPPVLIERVLVEGRPVAVYDSLAPAGLNAWGSIADLRLPTPRLHLPPGNQELEFEFTALSFRAPENVHFRYQLEGVDAEWVNAGDRRRASYPRLAPGKYRFRVIACNNSGLWNETGATLGFVVTPFFWQTWWFRTGGLAGFTLGLVALVRYLSFRRLRQQLLSMQQHAALESERARIAKDLHDDLGASLTRMTLMLELAKQQKADPQRSTAHVEEGIAAAQQAIKSLDETVWAVNPRNDTLPEMIDYLGQYAVDFLQRADIRCCPDLPETAPERSIAAELRHNVFLMVKETLNNIVQHASATEARFQVSLDGNRASIVIEDNGRGFSSRPETGSADGLRNLRDRAQAIGGECRIESPAGGGTRVAMIFPVGDREENRTQ